MRMISPIVTAMFFCGATPVAADEIALSMVHKESRIDIPASAIDSIEAEATMAFVIPGTKEKRVYQFPHVELCYTAKIQAQICQLTSRIVEQAMSLIVDCEPISKPVVDEPLCGPCLRISAVDIADANALAERLKRGSNRRCAPVS